MLFFLLIENLKLKSDSVEMIQSLVKKPPKFQSFLTNPMQKNQILGKKMVTDWNPSSKLNQNETWILNE